MTDTNKVPEVFIQGEGIYLRAPTEADLTGNWHRWFNDAEVTHFQDKGYSANTLEKQRSYFESIKDSDSDVVLAIVDANSHQHIGSVGLHQIDWIHRSAFLGIVIGEKDAWGKGFGRQAWRLITRHGFETLNLNKIVATTLDGNERSLACALASGFEIEGTQKEQKYKRGKFHDLILVGITRAMWDSAKP